MMSETVKLYPMDIRFSQKNIGSTFSGWLGKQKIGVVLDKIYNGDKEGLKNKILANMKVGRAPAEQKLPQLWFAVNNRSLWVLKQLQLLDILNDPITIEVDPAGIDKDRFSTKNGGEQVRVRKPPVEGKCAKDASFWCFNKPVLQSNEVKLLGGAESYAETYDSDYDSDEYYS